MRPDSVAAGVVAAGARWPATDTAHASAKTQAEKAARLVTRRIILPDR